jgi:hypothetical protein
MNPQQVPNAGSEQTAELSARQKQIVQVVQLLENLNFDQKSNLLEQVNSEEARAIFSCLELPLDFKPLDLERAIRRAAVVLWPSMLVKSGLTTSDPVILSKRLDGIYQALNAAPTRKELVKLAAQEGVPHPSGKPTPSSEKLTPKGVPPAKSKESEKKAGTQDSEPVSLEDAQLPTAERRSAGIPRRMLRTGVVSSAIMLGGLLGYREYEQSLVDLTFQYPSVNELLDENSEQISRLEPASKEAFKMSEDAERLGMKIGRDLGEYLRGAIEQVKEWIAKS